MKIETNNHNQERENKMKISQGHYFPTTRYGIVGKEELVGVQRLGWTVKYRTFTGMKPNPWQYFKSSHTWGILALVEVSRRCRAWKGEVYLLEVESMTERAEGVYEIPGLEGE